MTGRLTALPSPKIPGTAQKGKLERFIHQCTLDKEKGGPVYAFALVHFVGETPEEVDRVHCTGEYSAEELAKRFDERIRMRVQDLPGIQSCAIYAFFNEGVPGCEEPRDKLPFSATGRLEYPGQATEPPTERGLVGQMMRHLENMAQNQNNGIRELVGGFTTLMAAQNSRIESLETENQRVLAENADARNILLEARARVADRELENLMALSKKQRDDKLLELCARWGPSIINQMLGKKIFPAATEDTALVEGLLEHMGPDHIQMLQGMLSSRPGGTVAAGLIASRAGEYFKKRAERQQETEEAQRLALDAATPESEGA